MSCNNKNEKRVQVQPKDSQAGGTNCARCLHLQNEVLTVSQEVEKLEYMKPYTQQLLTQNDILKTRVKTVEAELTQAKQQLDVSEKQLWKYAMMVENVKQEYSGLQKQWECLEKSLELLTSKVKAAQLKNVELDTINRHQRCLLNESYNAYNQLKFSLPEDNTGEPGKTDISAET